MRKKIVAGNWKMNTTPAEGVELFKGVAAKKGEVCSCVNFIVAPPFTHLSEIVKAARGTGIAVSAQNCAAEAKGAYTGEVSAKMIASLGVEYVILGHSERREYYGETSQTLNKKMAQAYENNLAPIYCVGEKLEDREAGKHFDVVRAQIEEVVYNLTPEQFSKLIVAYEPVWARRLRPIRHRRCTPSSVRCSPRSSAAQPTGPLSSTEAARSRATLPSFSRKRTSTAA